MSRVEMEGTKYPAMRGVMAMAAMGGEHSWQHWGGEYPGQQEGMSDQGSSFSHFGFLQG